MTIVTLGLDLGKNWVHMVGLDEDGRIALRRRVRRHQLLAQTCNMPACLIGMEEEGRGLFSRLGGAAEALAL